MKSKRILIIGTVWPEPDSSAAGSRMRQIISLFLEQEFQVEFACASPKNDHAKVLENVGVTTSVIRLNHQSFDEYVKDLQPEIVVFDRFMTEEQYGWRVDEHCPNALKTLDTEDLHCLRSARQEALKNGISFKNEYVLQSAMAQREMASILRCDVSLIISGFEMDLLKNTFKIDERLLFYLPFLVKQNDLKTTTPSFVQRQHFMTIGNFLHPPNVDAVHYLKSSIWPLIRKELPEAELHIYGAYQPENIKHLHQPKEGFYLKGKAQNVLDTMQQYRICLAPLRFGAGLKGKLLDAMLAQTPSITSSIGFEGMNKNDEWCGFVADEPEDFAEKAIKLYKDDQIWQKASKKCHKIILENFSKEDFAEQFIETILSLKNTLKAHRTQNFLGQMLKHHTLASSKYLSKWIEEKQKNQEKLC